MKRLIPFLLVLGALFSPSLTQAQFVVQNDTTVYITDNIVIAENVIVKGKIDSLSKMTIIDAQVDSVRNTDILAYGNITMDGTSGIHMIGNFNQADKFVCTKTSKLEFYGDAAQSYQSQSTPPTPYKIGHLIVDSPKLNLLSDMTVMAGGTVEFSNSLVKINEINGRANGDSKLIMEAIPAEKALFLNIDTGVGDASPLKKNYVNGIIRYQTGGSDSYLFPVGDNSSFNLMKLDFPPGTLTDNSVKMFDVKFGYDTPPGTTDPGCAVTAPKPYTGVWEYIPYTDITGTTPLTALTVNNNTYTITLNPRNFTLPYASTNFTTYFEHTGQPQYFPHRGLNTQDSCNNYTSPGQLITVTVRKFSKAIGVQSDNPPFPNNQITIGAQSGRNTINVNWNVEIPKDVAGFNVERSQDGNTFQTVATGIGAESTRNYYNYTDRNVKTNQNYFYRVKVTANGGETTYTRIVQARLNQLAQTPTLEANFYPNPTDGTLTLEVNANQPESVTLKVVDLLGKIVVQKSLDVQNGSNRFDLSGETAKMSAGTYNIVLSSESGIKTTKLVKN